VESQLLGASQDLNPALLVTAETDANLYRSLCGTEHFCIIDNLQSVTLLSLVPLCGALCVSIPDI